MCRIGMVGLGLVGTAIAEMLLQKDFELIGFDVDRQRCKFLRKRGAMIVKSATEAACDVDCVILSLPDSAVVDDVLGGSGGILESESRPR
jgi:3-hydroxyisobutyrate dehydrogenase